MQIVHNSQARNLLATHRFIKKQIQTLLTIVVIVVLARRLWRLGPLGGASSATIQDEHQRSQGTPKSFSTANLQQFTMRQNTFFRPWLKLHCVSASASAVRRVVVRRVGREYNIPLWIPTSDSFTRLGSN
jgi:hypothetical protein